MPSDAAFMAREKAKADAEFYTAAKFAEANRVKCIQFFPPGAMWKRLFILSGIRCMLACGY